MTELPRVSVIIVSWNARHLLERFLPSVASTAYPNVELVLADNGSTDDSVAWTRHHHPDVRIIQHPENWGFCRGNNEAIRQTEGDYVVLLNNDVEVGSGWLDHLVACAEETGWAAVQPKLLQVDERKRFEYAGAAGGLLDRYGYPFARGRIFDHLELDEGQFDERAEIFWGSGAALLLRRSALDDVGLLDEGFEFHMEEIDLCWRLWRAGYSVGYEPRARVWHLGGGSLPASSPRKTYFNFRNSLLMLYKNLTPRAWWSTFPRRALLDGLAWGRFLSRGEFAQAGAVIQAYWDAHWAKRRYEQPAETVLPWYRRSIALDAFVRGKKTVAELDKTTSVQRD